MRIPLEKLRHSPTVRRFGQLFVLVFAVSLVALILFHLLWLGKIFPGVRIASIPVGGLGVVRASQFLETQTAAFIGRPIEVTGDEERWEISPAALHLRYSIAQAVQEAYNQGRQGGLAGLTALTSSLSSRIVIDLPYTLDEKALTATISAFAATLDVPAVAPAITVLTRPDPETGSRIAIQPGENGQRVDVSGLRREVHDRLQRLASEPIALIVQTIPPTATPVDLTLTRQRAEALLGKRLTLGYAGEAGVDNTWELGGEDLVHFLSFDGGFDVERIASYSASLAEQIDRHPVNATFVVRDGRVVEFSPERDGLRLHVQQTVGRLREALASLDRGEGDAVAVDIPVEYLPAAIKAADVNTLGIRELLGRGESTFHGSIANREHNIALAASRVSGVLVAPGESFSFNEAVGDVSAASGYRQAYVIKSGRTILDDGGGVCQVSTTLFRAALRAGLPILARTAHSYRVSYYEQNEKPGFDATVFAPRVDLVFQNDTPAHLLIQAEADTKANTLVFEIYGTSDGRRARVENHRVWDVTPPPPDLYQDDPALPLGVVKQVDWKAWGAKVKYDYRVERDGETIFQKTFYSNFRPWQSVFLRGTGGT